MEMEQVLLAETRGAVRLLTLNRPKKLNALNADLLKALTEALFAVRHDDAIAAVHGYALGAGCSLALGCDLVVAAESARFGFPELRAGLTASTVTAHAVHTMAARSPSSS